MDPYIPDGEVPKVEHDAPLPDIETVPVTRGAGLTPGDAISVEPKGIPVGETVEPVVMPSGEVAPMVGVGLTIPLTCALAALQMTGAARIAVINATLSRILRFAMNSSGARFSDIGQSLSRGSFERSAAADVQIVIQRLVPLRLPCIEPRKSSLLSAVRCRMRTEIFGPRLNLNDGRRGCRRWSCFEWAGLGSHAACNQHAREDRCSEKDTHGATRSAVMSLRRKVGRSLRLFN